jgi:hypothetical protein
MRTIGHRRLLAVLIPAGCLVAGLGSGAAYAYFTAPGTGSGTASIGTLQNVTVETATGTVVNKLIPGGTGDVTLTVSNTNNFPVSVVRVDPNGTPTSPACGTTGVTFAAQDSLDDTIAANGSTTITLANAASMDASSDASCQGATFSIPVTITVQK